VTAAGLLPASPARADTCGPLAGFEAVFPVPGSTQVPPNGKVRVRYAAGGVHEDPIAVTANGEPVEGVTCPLDDSCPGNAAEGNRELTFEPALSFLPENASIDATATDEDGHSVRWSFETGRVRDTDPPVLGPVETIDWDWLGNGPDDDPCGPQGLVRYQVSLSLPPAEDVVGRENVEYELFRLNGPDVVGGAPVLDAIALDDGRARRVEVRDYLAADSKWARRLCFSVGALDLAGNFTSGQNERCVHLREGPFFRSCSATPGAVGGGAGVGVLGIFAALAHWRRR
jgi:hypothetical protein